MATYVPLFPFPPLLAANVPVQVSVKALDVRTNVPPSLASTGVLDVLPLESLVKLARLYVPVRSILSPLAALPGGTVLPELGEVDELQAVAAAMITAVMHGTRWVYPRDFHMFEAPGLGRMGSREGGLQPERLGV